jgi:hypothetical protein
MTHRAKNYGYMPSLIDPSYRSGITSSKTLKTNPGLLQLIIVEMHMSPGEDFTQPVIVIGNNYLER